MQLSIVRRWLFSTSAALLLAGSILVVVGQPVDAQFSGCLQPTGMTIDRIAGARPDNGVATPATSVVFEQVGDVDQLPDGTLLVSDRLGSLVYAVDLTTGETSPWLGTGVAGDAIDRAATNAVDLDDVFSIHVGADGTTVATSRRGHSVVAVNPGSATVDVLTGDGLYGSDVLGIDDEYLRPRFPQGVARASDGTTYISDAGFHRIFRIEADQTLTLIAGGDAAGPDGDGGRADEAKLWTPAGIALSPDETILYVAESGSHRIRAIDLVGGGISTVAGDTTGAYGGDGGPATDAQLRNPYDVAVDASGNLVIADTNNHRIRYVDRTTGIITTIAGTGLNGTTGDAGAATDARIGSPRGVAILDDGDIAIAHVTGNRVRRIDSTTGTITTIAGGAVRSSDGDGGPATDAVLFQPWDSVEAPDGSTWIVERSANRVRRIAADGTITTVAGGSQGFSGDGGPATAAQLGLPRGIAFGPDGTAYLADTNNWRVRAIAPDGTISTVAGSGVRGAPIEGAAIASPFDHPVDVAVDGTTLYISLLLNHQVAAVDLTTGELTIAAGTGVASFSGDGGAATAAELNRPDEIAVIDGALWINDRTNQALRRLDPASGLITTEYEPSLNMDSFVVDDAGMMHLASANRLWTMEDRTTRVAFANTLTVAGQVASNSGDGPSSETGLWGPRGLHLHSDGAITVVASGGHEVFELTPATDSDADGLSDAQEGTLDRNENGTPDHLDADSDGDGVLDGDECPENVLADADSDDIKDVFDDDDDNDGVARLDEPGDTDGDGTPDAIDIDDDGDFIPSWVEGTADADNDGIGNMWDDDSDGDGIPDALEGYADADGDTIPDFLDPDLGGWRLALTESVMLADGQNGLVIGNETNDRFGTDVKAIGDLDGDGVVDILVGAQEENGNEGAAYVVFLNTDGSAKATTRIDPTTMALTGNSSFGVSIAPLGDLDGDGVQEIAIGARSADSAAPSRNPGAVVIAELPANGAATLERLIDDTDPAIAALGIQTSDSFGRSVAAIGDIDGNGVDDLATSAWAADRQGVRGVGSVQVLFLDQSFGIVAATTFDPFDLGETLYPNTSFGDDVTSAGDVDGDGVPDLYVSARATNWRNTVHGYDGEVWEVLLNRDGTPKASRRILSTDDVWAASTYNDDAAGTGIEIIPDLDGNGVDDLAIGIYAHDTMEADEGGVMIVLRDDTGAAIGTQTIDRRHPLLHGTPTVGAGLSLNANADSGLGFHYFFGHDVSWLGDLDGDGRPSLAIANHQNNQNGERRGAVFIVEIGESDLDGDGIPDTEEQPGDTDDDGRADVLDPDDDGDGIPTADEDRTGDFDGDDVPDHLDPDLERVEVIVELLDGDGNPVANASITLVDAAGNPIVLTTDANGLVRFVSVLGDEIVPGAALVSSTGASSEQTTIGAGTQRVTLRLPGAAAPTPPPALAFTGAESSIVAKLGFVLLIAGIAMVAAGGGLTLIREELDGRRYW